MKYVSFDLETTSLVPSPEHILGIALVIEDTEKDIPVEDLPTFACIINHKEFKGQAYALSMNSWILDMLSKKVPAKYPVYNFHGENGRLPWMDDIKDFLYAHLGRPRYNLGGKNVGTFDLNFMPDSFRELWRHRVVDLGSVFVDWNEATLPDLATIKKKANIPGIVTHDMVEDARDVIRCARTTYKKVDKLT